MQIDPVAAAHKLLAANNVGEAVTLIARAASAGDAAALLQQALWHLAGSPLPRDLPRARARFSTPMPREAIARPD